MLLRVPVRTMHPWITQQLAKERQRDFTARADRARLARESRHVDPRYAARGWGAAARRATWRWLWPGARGAGSLGRSSRPWPAPIPPHGPGAGPYPGDSAYLSYRAFDIAERHSLFSGRWSSRVVARFNDCEIKVVKVQGGIAWQTHQDTDELFLVSSGRLTIRMRDGAVTLGPGQLFVVPRGLEHSPIADGEAHTVLIEVIQRDRRHLHTGPARSRPR